MRVLYSAGSLAILIDVKVGGIETGASPSVLTHDPDQIESWRNNGETGEFETAPVSRLSVDSS